MTETNNQELFSAKLCKEYMDRPAIISDSAMCTYERMYRAIDGFATKLSEMGVEKESRVALWGYNSVNMLIAFFAIVKAGGVAVLVNYSMSIEEAEQLLSMTDTQFIICGDNSAFKKDDRLLEHLASRIGIGTEQCFDIRKGRSDLSCDYLRDEPTEDARTEDEADRTALIIFTSGTTSTPKAVKISQRAFSFHADVVLDNSEGYSGNSVCVAVPLFHIFGLAMSYTYLCKGATVCIPESYKPERLVQMMRLELQYKNATFINMYGQGEAAPLTMVHPSDLVEKRAQTVGRPAKGLDIRIVDGTGKDIPRGEVGEVIARGNNLMNGYDNLLEEKQTIDKEGWLHTGDLGYFDEEGFLHLAGRIKDVIIRGGESVEACVTMTDGQEYFEQEAIKEELRKQIARYKVPSHIFLYDSFPLNENGKINQRALRADMLTRLRQLEIDAELAGDIDVKITLMPEWLRVAFSDNGVEYYIDKRRDVSASAKIILNAVNDFHTDYIDDKPVYCMDFLYEKNKNIWSSGFLWDDQRHVLHHPYCC
ncbi:MAG: acyl--CoA ligase [Acetatifactor sp.]|nr:acyl--CoA ligase [Acetatifactor sp.]